MNEVNLDNLRRNAERRLADLRAERGRAIVDGRAAGDLSAKIAAVQAEIEAISDAGAEADKRQAADDVVTNREFFAHQIGAIAAARGRRLSAIAKANAAAKECGLAIREALNEAAVAERAFQAMANAVRPGEYHHESSVTAASVRQRFGTYLAATLRETTGLPSLGGLSLAGAAMTEPGGWSAQESNIGDSSASFERYARPPAIADEATGDDDSHDDDVGESEPASPDDDRDAAVNVSEATVVRASPTRASKSTKYGPKDSRLRGLKRDSRLIAADAPFAPSDNGPEAA